MNSMSNGLTIRGKEYTIQEGAVRVLALRSELIDEILDPEAELKEIKRERPAADMLTFLQRPFSSSCQLPYFMEWDNRAVLEIRSFEDWFKHQIPKQTRTLIRKAENKGVSVQVESFSDKLVEGLVDIFNETSMRQGRRNYYYGWDREMVRRVWAKDLDRSFWIVAYCESEMIGFIKLVVGDGIARPSGTVAKLAHRDKAPMNALFSKSVELCAAKGIPLLVYGQFIYGRKGEDSLTVFKMHNGFKRIEIPRYYVPLSIRGRVGLCFGLHRGLSNFLPGPVLRLALKVRSKWYNRVVVQ
jgi:hypothetical protein